MKRNLRGKIREYIQSEEGKVGVKSPLTLGVAAGGLLLAHSMVGTPDAEAHMCSREKPECPPGRTCKGPFIWNGMVHEGTCIPD